VYHQVHLLHSLSLLSNHVRSLCNFASTLHQCIWIIALKHTSVSGSAVTNQLLTSQFHFVCHVVLATASWCTCAHASNISLRSNYIWPHHTPTYYSHYSEVHIMILTPLASRTRWSHYNFAQSITTYFCMTFQFFNVICAFFIAQLHNLHGNTNTAQIHLELASITEFAGHTLGTSSSSSSIALSNRNWLADTGATSHMTPHRHWMHNYTPLRIPIRLADNRVIYSSRVGTVVFNLVIDGKRLQTLEFTKILHVPELENSLFSCLYLTKHKGFEICIDSHHMDFICNGHTLFRVPIDVNNCAHLFGSIEPLPESANWVSTLPLTPSLWHCHCFHHNFADIAKMHKDASGKWVMP